MPSSISKSAQKYLNSLDAGARSWIIANHDEGDKLTSGEAKRGYRKYEGVLNNFLATVPQELIDNVPDFKKLPLDEMQGVLASYNIMLADNKDKAEKMEKAYEMAVRDSDPYMKQILRTVADETMRYFEEAEGDYISGVERVNRRREEIEEDLIRNKDVLGIELSADLARQAETYRRQTRERVMIAAENGITFGTGELSRLGLQSNLDIINDDIVQSTKRQFGNKITELTIAAARGDQDAVEQLADMERNYGSRITEIGRSAEKYLGSDLMQRLLNGEDISQLDRDRGFNDTVTSLDGTPVTPNTNNLSRFGYETLGGIFGKHEEARVKDIENRKNAHFAELNQDSLDFASLR